ncbi:hypothetical protein SAMN02745246_00733 [Leeuwenhoekiella marinoflava DSM 3653]|uniref:Uncharacterized protein n=2 Tax=Leeuwenhoekiella marinoflava TaxID=988 RepID=A0A4Q0PSH4_9FLAO|nr:DUF2200 family protein [Leeuwenhoekiella marinoflava]RXG32895.1 putative protein DUF2200 [Leeuwenhoekiella marinoflava]SHE60724.1 hypothetical protein SAMN02745246_00733 [Leeuwenhoekiella marinoflava DSM 3653]
MKTIPEHNQRIATMIFSSVYPHYVSNVAQKGRTQTELHQVIECSPVLMKPHFKL